MVRNVDGARNGLGCVLDRIYRGVSDWEDGVMDNRPYPELLSREESKELLSLAESLWADLQSNKIGGYSGINRPFWILNHFKEAIEKFGHRDIGQTWSMNDLDSHPEKPA